MFDRRRRALLALIGVAAVIFPMGNVAAVTIADGRPNTCSAVTTTSSQNKWFAEPLGSGDVDWFRFYLSSTKRMQIVLGELPANYRVELYSSCSTKLASSDQSGRQFEEIVKKLPAGTYRVRVSSAVGASAATAYKLRFRPLAAGIPVLSSSWYDDEIGYTHLVGEVLNNTGSNREFVRVTATYYNSVGSVVATDYTYTDRFTLRPGWRSSFHLFKQIPTTAVRYTVRVSSSSSTTASPVRNLSLARGPSYTDDGGYRHYPGMFKNGNTYTIEFAQVSATFYNSVGTVIDTEYTYADPHTISAGASSPYDLFWYPWRTPNRVSFAADAIR